MFLGVNILHFFSSGVEGFLHDQADPEDQGVGVQHGPEVRGSDLGAGGANLGAARAGKVRDEGNMLLRPRLWLRRRPCNSGLRGRGFESCQVLRFPFFSLFPYDDTES